MKNKQFIERIILLFSVLLSKLSRLISRINSIKIVEKAPYFLLNGYNKNNPSKNKWYIDNYYGEWIILYFHPKNISIVYSLGAKGFHDNPSIYKKLNGTLVGISPNKKADHKLFCVSKEIGYKLLSDINLDIIKSYDSWLYSYSKSNTFIINTKVVIVLKWFRFRALVQAQDCLKKLFKKQKIYA